jgi:hypothetical protein
LEVVAVKDRIEAVLEVERETKRTYRYRELPAGERPEVIGTLYVQKWATGNPPPQRIRLTVEPA